MSQADFGLLAQLHIWVKLIGSSAWSDSKPTSDIHRGDKLIKAYFALILFRLWTATAVKRDK